ncbi:Thiamine pyrophosphokinase 1 [Smittium mucronatum]|uniref:Thiamine pyrophosphokinase 1 n=1 Tax=Smittium mucronatum TaxID=133383 RepID=A0A1R0GZD4_9FUNG|nr:Thiamine pyrophosphokinase 1 [Smittium mucronatum]
MYVFLFKRYLPTAIVGDLDSLDQDSKSYYAQNGVRIERDPSQDTTDFQKCLQFLESNQTRLLGSEKYFVVVLGGYGGRLDHTLHILKVLINQCHNRKIYFLTNDNISFALPNGENFIQTTKGVDGPTCGILPLSGECTMSTKGLRWNVEDTVTSVTGLMSTSNIIDDDQFGLESLPAYCSSTYPKTPAPPHPCAGTNSSSRDFAAPSTIRSSTTLIDS